MESKLKMIQTKVFWRHIRIRFLPVFISADCNWWLWKCTKGNMRNLQIRRTFFLAFISADSNNWLWNKIKITLFNIFVIGGGRVTGKFWTFTVGDGGYQNQASACKGGGGVQIFVILWKRKNWMPLNFVIVGNLDIPGHTHLTW